MGETVAYRRSHLHRMSFSEFIYELRRFLFYIVYPFANFVNTLTIVSISGLASFS